MRLLLTIALAVALGSCGGGSDGACSVHAQKQFVLDVAQDWYLFLDLLQVDANPGAYASASDYLDALTAKARDQNKDRHFSFLTTRQALATFLDDGQAIVFGIGIHLDTGNRLFVTGVESVSPAAEASFARGDEILAIGPSPDKLVPVSTMRSTQVSDAFGPSQVGVMRSFSVKTTGGQAVTRTMTKRVVNIDTVPTVAIFPRQGLTPVGYVAFQTFIQHADATLRSAFDQFRQQDVRDVVVDLRYNGGGLVSIAQLLSNLLAANHNGQVMFNTSFNAKQSGSNSTTDFSSEPQAIPALRIAFITTKATASASELVIKFLEPYAQVAIIGGQTFGKPVGQRFFSQNGCDTVLGLISFQDLNRDNEGGYFDGLPDAQFSGAFCAAADDLSAPRGSLNEASTATAYAWINNNACPAAKALATQASYPMPAQPDIAQINRPGLF